MKICLACVWILSFICLAHCLIEEIDFPSYLKDCINLKKQNAVTETISEAVCNTCVTRYMWAAGPNLKKCGHPGDNTTTVEITKFFGKLLCDQHSNTRKKRNGRNYMRKEIRMLNKFEMGKLKRAWRQAYDSGYFGWIARFHNDQIRTSAHVGPAFLGYHRFLLLILESILKYYDPDVTLPYWNSGIDALLDNPANSIAFTDDYLGDMTGIVNSGLCGGFQDLYRNPIVRNGGNAGSLFTTRDARTVLNMPNIMILTEPSPYPTLESFHDDVHNFIGGSMGPIESAPWDCIFWLHHAYVDYIWEFWRYNHGYNTMYPQKAGVPDQQPNVQMKGMPYVGFLGRIPNNRDGYSSTLARKSYYQLSPSCSRYNTYCGSPDLQCKIGFRGAECVAVDKRFRRETEPLKEARRQSHVNFRYTNEGRKKRGTDEHGYNENFEFSVPADQIDNIHIPMEKQPCMGRPIQNNFIADCSSDVKNWAFIPIKIVHLRPSEVHYPSKSSIRSSGGRYDMYDEHGYDKLRKYIHPGNPAVYQDCMEDESGAFKVRLKSSGLSYFGVYTDYVFVDNRLPVSSHIGYVAVQKPTSYRPTEALVTASDACGRLCKATCAKREGNHVYYEACTGAIKVTDQSPLMYGKDFGEAVLSIWEFNGKFTPRESEHNIFMEFYCDYSDKWVWDECTKGRGK